MSVDAPPPQVFVDRETARLWHEFSDRRLADFSHRIDEFRSWARQFVAWVAVLVGLEVNLLPRLKETFVKPPEPSWWAVLQFLLAALVLQVLSIVAAGGVGFMASWIQEPEKPSRLIHDLRSVDAVEAHRMLGAYSAKALDSYSDRANSLASWMRWVALVFLGSVFMFLLAAFCYSLSFLAP